MTTLQLDNRHVKPARSSSGQMILTTMDNESGSLSKVDLEPFSCLSNISIKMVIITNICQILVLLQLLLGLQSNTASRQGPPLQVVLSLRAGIIAIPMQVPLSSGGHCSVGQGQLDLLAQGRLLCFPWAGSSGLGCPSALLRLI